MDLGGLPVHHGLVTMAGLGLTGATSFGRSDRWNLAAGERKWRGGGLEILTTGTRGQRGGGVG
jgi:hypothetical protein